MRRSGIKIEQSLRDEIRNEYLLDELTLEQVALKYGVSKSVTWKIVHEQDGQEKATTLEVSEQIKRTTQTEQSNDL